MLTQEKRPFSFDDMIGQKGILSEMRRRSVNMDFPEVMIFSGPSGTGKTTLAYIIAALLTDPNPIVDTSGTKTPNPESASSKAILEEKFNRDTKLYDASSMGKDDVINLGKSISHSPLFDSKKIIIIDEAQELSKAGKGVTLELLEKKRKDTHIILCTMNLDSFEKAVQSRGHVYHFRSPNSEQIVEYLFKLSEDFDLEMTEEVEEFYSKGIFMLAENCDGSVRMAVQNFERCMYGKFFTEQEIEHEFSFISNEKLTTLISKILKKDPSCIKEIKDFGTKDFYYKALKTLSDAFLYNSTGYVDKSWKTTFANSIKDFNLEEVITAFLEADNGPYFREDLFFFQLAKLMKKESKKTLIKLEEKPKTRERIPVTRVKA